MLPFSLTLWGNKCVVFLLSEKVLLPGELPSLGTGWPLQPHLSLLCAGGPGSVEGGLGRELGDNCSGFAQLRKAAPSLEPLFFSGSDKNSS